MQQVSNRRLANLRTRSETGYDHVIRSLDIQTPFGQKQVKETKPFYPGQEKELRQEFDKIESMVGFIRGESKAVGVILEAFMVTKDITNTIRKSGSNVLSEVEIYELKSALLNTAAIRKAIMGAGCGVPEEFVPLDTEGLLDVLDPRHDRMNTFYLYDDFSEQLAEYRREKKAADTETRRINKRRGEELKRKYGIVLTPKFDIVIGKSSDSLAKAMETDELEKVSEDYMSVTFALTANAEVYDLIRKSEELTALIDDEEEKVRSALSARISEDADTLLENFKRIGRLDHVMAKAMYAIRHDCVKPEITDEHIIEIEDGRNLAVEDILTAKGKKYCPVSITLTEGVTCITGANMGGKTISLKLAGLVPVLAQYGYFVPCRSARIGLSNFMQILIGDSQSVERGLSSFGSEMEELNEILTHARDRSLILIDEIASGTNPVEGLALTKSIVEYLLRKPYITLITTHFETVTEEKGVRNMQVRGLANVDFRLLDRELREATRRERINIISKYMDYRLYLVDGKRQIPKDALNIAKMLGISKEIIEGAQKYIK